MIPSEYAALVGRLLTWYDTAAAALPWRGQHDPYPIWLSEVMLQQTQVATVIPYFERFMAAFPTVQALAAAPLDDVLKLWEGLGYYSRARNLHRAAQMVAQSGFPRTAEGLQRLPGVGRYTAGAIAAIAYGEPVAALDGNVIRVLTRLCDVADPVDAPSVQQSLWQTAEALAKAAPPDRVGDYTQAIMELGREVCRPRNPTCPSCPVQALCSAHAAGTQAARPVKAAKTPLPHYDYAGLLIADRAGRYLIVQRRPKGLLGGLWAFPATRADPHEALKSCAERALRKGLGVSAHVGEQVFKVAHTFTHFHMTLHLFIGTVNGEPHSELSEYAGFTWATPADMDGYAFDRANRHAVIFLQRADKRLF